MLRQLLLARRTFLRSISIAACVLTSMACSFGFSQTATSNFTRFRGPNADGVSADNGGLPTSWNETENVQWVADVPGWAWSSPIIWEDKVFITTCYSEDDSNEPPKKGLYLGQGVRKPEKGIHHWKVYCHDLATGKRRWEREAHSGEPSVPRHPKASYASETPATDGERLYVLFGDLGLYCFDFEGNELWKHPIEPRKTLMDYGAAASPVLHEDQVIIVYDNMEDSFVAAFDKRTGQQNWKTERDEISTWATPFIWQNELRTEIIVNGKKKNRSYDLNGNLLWEFDGKSSNLVIPSPYAADGMLYIASGYVGDKQRPTCAIRPGASGDISLVEDATSNEYIAWFLPKAGPYNPSTIVYQGLYYTLFDRGFITCHDAKTGEEVYGRESIDRGSTFTSSPWAYNGKLFFLSEDGDTYVVKAGKEFELLGKNSLSELCLATPSVSKDKLLIRTLSKVYCISNSQSDSAE